VRQIAGTRLAPRAERIRDLVDVARGCIIEVGRELIAAKEEVPHGQWLAWLQREFRWSHDTAMNYMRAARAFPEIPNGSEFDGVTIEGRALYALSAPGVPQEIRDEAVAQAKGGKHITEAEVEKLIAEHVAKAIEGKREGHEAAPQEREDEYLGQIKTLKPGFAVTRHTRWICGLNQ